MQSSKEEQGEKRKHPYVKNAKKNRRKQQNGKDQRALQEIRDTKGTYYAKMDTIKERNGVDLTETGDIKRGGKNTQKNYI